MKIIINSTAYTGLKNLNFSPETDVFGNSLPINEFRADIITTDDIAMSQWAELRDDLNTLWAKYWIVYAERIDRQTVRIQVQSALRLLERKQMPAVMYEVGMPSSSMTDVLDDIFDGLDVTYTVTPATPSYAVVGFCPAQNARDRLLWLLLTQQRYVRSFFSDTVEIRLINDQTAPLIPLERTFWKPSITYRDYVTAINVRSYQFVAGTPTPVDKWVTPDDQTYYIVVETNYRLVNPDVPAGVPDNEISIDGVTLITGEYTASRVLSHLALYYFKRQDVDIDIINNAEYAPGDRVTVYLDEGQLAVGYIGSAAFGFGNQAKAKLKLSGVEVVEGATLTILHVYSGIQIGEQKLYLPVGYPYEIDNPYHDTMIGTNRYIFRPLTAKTTGTLDQDTTVTVNYAIALNAYTVTDSSAGIAIRQEVLAITSVSGVAMDAEETDVAVIE